MAYKQNSPTTVPEGATGNITFTAFAPIVGGTSSTSALQNATTGFSTSGLVLTSNGSAALPSFKAGSSNCIVMSAILPSPCITTRVSFCNFGSAFLAGETGTVIPYNCVARNLYCLVRTNASSIDCTVTLRKNASSTALQVTIPAGQTGTFNDTNAAHAVSVSAGDLLDWEGSQSSTGNISNTTIVMQLNG